MSKLLNPELSGHAELLRNQPWFTQNIQLTVQPAGMLGASEAMLCYYLARDAFKGAGTIVDAGSFLGRSACFFAEGLRANPHYVRERDRIHCFDNFLVNESATVEFIRVELNRTVAIGESTRDLFDSQVSTVSDMLEIHAGDFQIVSWAGQPIEILMVDIAKSPNLGSRVVELFFSCLIPGESLVIQQDYHHPWLPHIHVTMEYLADYFSLLIPRVDDSAVFGYLAGIPADILRRAIDYDFTYEEKLQLMDRAVSRLPEQDRYCAELARLVLQFGKTREAVLRTELEELRGRLEAARPGSASLHYFAEVADYLDELEGWRCKDDGNFERCLQLAEKALARRPSIYNMTMRGIALRELGRYGEAEVQLIDALKLGPPPGYPSGDTYVELAKVMSSQTRHAEAETVLLRGALDRGAGIPSIRYFDMLLQIWAITDAGLDKIPLLASLQRQLPQDPEVCVLEAWLRQRNGDQAGAGVCLDAAARLGLPQQRLDELRTDFGVDRSSL